LPPVSDAAERVSAPFVVAFFSKHKAAFTVAFVVVVLALAALAYVLFLRKSPTRGTGAIHKLAVLPFVNKRPDGGSFDVVPALADSIINRLGMIRALVVRPTPYVEKYADTDISPEQVAQELDVNFLLTGSYLIDGEAVTVYAQLIDVEHKTQLWGES